GDGLVGAVAQKVRAGLEQRELRIFRDAPFQVGKMRKGRLWSAPIQRGFCLGKGRPHFRVDGGRSHGPLGWMQGRRHSTIEEGRGRDVTSAGGGAGARMVRWPGTEGSP